MPGPRRGSLKRESKTIATRRLRFWKNTLTLLVKRRAHQDVSSSLLAKAFNAYQRARRNYMSYIERGVLISTTSFEDVFEGMGDEQCLLHFRFFNSLI